MSIQNTPFSISKKEKSPFNYPTSAAVGFLQGTQDRVRNNRGRRAISVRATEVLLYFVYGKASRAHYLRAALAFRRFLGSLEVLQHA